MLAYLPAKFWRFQSNRIRRLRGRLSLRNFRLADTAECYEARALTAEREWEVARG